MLDRDSTPEAKRQARDVVFSELASYFFDKVVFINIIYSDFGGGGTVSTTNYDKDSRIIDTSGGRLMAPGKESRMRCQFYLKNPSKLSGYLLSPSVLDSYDTSIITTDLTPLRSYFGLKFNGTSTSVVVKEAGKNEVEYPTDFTMTMFDATYTDTFSLEILHNIKSTDIYINGKSYGSYKTDLVGNTTVTQTFYPFFAPGKSTDGTSVNIVVENLQFIQNR